MPVGEVFLYVVWGVMAIVSIAVMAFVLRERH